MSVIDRPEAPVLLIRGGDSWPWVMQGCPFCAKRHVHGGGRLDDDRRRLLGLRLAHCLDARPEQAAIYALVEG